MVIWTSSQSRDLTAEKQKQFLNKYKKIYDLTYTCNMFILRLKSTKTIASTCKIRSECTLLYLEFCIKSLTFITIELQLA